jgi:hypothetical protein
MKKDTFSAILEQTVQAKFAELISKKDIKEKYLNYIDAVTLTSSVRNIFIHKIEFVPPQVDAACKMAEAILAPSAAERTNLLKAAVAVGGGSAGIGMIIGGIGAALGWGAGAIEAVTVFFTGAALLGPIGWIIGGVTIAAVAGYFAIASTNEQKSEKFLTVLISGVKQATDIIWEEYKDQLSKDI